MEKLYRIKESTLRNLTESVKNITGKTEEIVVGNISNEINYKVEELDNEIVAQSTLISEQDNKIAELAEALNGKASSGGNPNLINFTVTVGNNFASDTYEVQAEDGMTWGEWVYSDYNPLKIKSASSYINIIYASMQNVIYTAGVGSPSISLDGSDIYTYDTIIANKNYTAIYVASCCFVAGTKILTSLGGSTKPIEEINIGDEIVSYNIQTNKNYIAKVKNTIIKEDTIDIAEVTFSNGTTLIMNAYHPIYTETGFHSITLYNDYNELVIGDKVKALGNWVEVTNIKRYKSEPIITYNLDIIDKNEVIDNELNDTYYANNIVVHNGFC